MIMPNVGGSGPSIRYRPIFGGVFGRDGQYVLSTMPCVDRGLHAVRFMVLQPKTGGVLAVSCDKRAALADARRLIRAGHFLARTDAANEPRMEQISLWPDEQTVDRPDVPAEVIPRRRKEVFELSNGKCFYCGKALTLNGKWHLEHQMPRALMGPDELPTLVASCPSCNCSKKDKTAIEYVLQTQVKALSTATAPGSVSGGAFKGRGA